MSESVNQSINEEAVEHARLAKKAGDLSWDHIRAEYTQDSYKIAATLATNTPVAWTLARPSEAAGGAYRFLAGTTFEEVRAQYEVLRTQLEIHGWEPLLEIRSGWYTLSQGISKLRIPATGQFTKGETVVMFPVGKDGILGELQIATVGRLENGRAPVDEDRLPLRRMAALEEHEAFIEALRTENVEKIVTAHIPDVAVAVRNYVTEQSSLLNIAGSDALMTYYTQLFAKYRVLDIQLVNRIAETWYVFAELHWTVEERGGARRTLEFCTGDVAALDPDRKYWVKTGAGTDPVEVRK